MAEKKTQAKKSGENHQPVRLYVRGTFIGFQRSHNVQEPNHALVKVDGVNSKDDGEFYLGKRLVYIYTAKNKRNESHYRTIWGKIRRTHGNNGLFRAHFKKNLPSRAMGSTLRVMLYPSRV